MFGGVQFAVPECTYWMYRCIKMFCFILHSGFVFTLRNKVVNVSEVRIAAYVAPVQFVLGDSGCACALITFMVRLVTFGLAVYDLI